MEQDNRVPMTDDELNTIAKAILDEREEMLAEAENIVDEKLDELAE